MKIENGEFYFNTIYFPFSILHSQFFRIPYYAELRAMIVQNSQSFKNQFPFYLTNEKGLGLPIDKDYVPYMFILDENMRTSNMFVVDMMFQPLLEKYFNVLIENYR